MPHPRESVMLMPRSGIRHVMDLAWTTPGVVHLEVGEPDFPTPEHIGAAAKAAIDEGRTRYTPNAGIGPLREALAEKVRVRNGMPATADNIVVAAGAVQAIYASLVSVINPGDEILLPDPGWPNFRMMATLLSARPVFYPLRPENGFLPEAGEIESLITPRTRVLLVNSPSNPLGAVIPRQVVESLVDLVGRHDLWLVSDECYDEITFGTPLVSPGSIDQDRIISTFSFSKTYAMTGWRVGYAVAPAELAAVATKVQEPLISCVNEPAQYAALTALTGSQECVARMCAAYRERRDAAVHALRSEGITHLVPQGAFYQWIDISRSGMSSLDFALGLITREGIAVAPGSAFGDQGEGWIRVSLANDVQRVRQGVDAIARMLKSSEGVQKS